MGKLAWCGLALMVGGNVWAATENPLPIATTDSELATIDSPAPPSETHFQMSFGTGIENAGGNRGELWQNDMPVADLKIGFTSNSPLSAQLGVTRTQHDYFSDSTTAGTVDITSYYLSIDAKYRISFSHYLPQVILGIGTAFKQEHATGNDQMTSDRAFLMSAGLAWEIPLRANFALVPEFRYRTIAYSDSFRSVLINQYIPDLTGAFTSMTVSLLATF